MYHVVGCDKVGMYNISITIKQKLERGQFICFHGSDKLPSVRSIHFKGGSDLRTALQNCWYSDGGSAFFSLLCMARAIHIEDRAVLRDLISYVDGAYDLCEHWK